MKFKALLTLGFLAATLVARADNFTFTITNQNSLISDPWVTFVQSVAATSDATNPIGPALSATAGATSLVSGTSYQLSAIGTTLTMDTNWAGNIFFSDSDITNLLGSSGQGTNHNQPTLYATNPATTSLTTTRYNYIEFGGGSSTNVQPDITYINYYSVPLQMTNVTTGQSRGTPTSQASLDTLLSRLAAIPTNTSQTVSTATNGVARVISPDNNNSQYFPSYKAYIDASFDAGAKTINLANEYSHSGTTALTTTQTWTTDAINGVTFENNTLTISGTSTNTDVGTFILTWEGSADDLSNAVYAQVLAGYTVIYSTGTQTGGNTGNNDVFSEITRDLLAGYSFGFINSDATTPGNIAIGNLTSEQWMQLTIEQAFSNAQPGDHGTDAYYNPWAGEIALTFQDVYSFPFNDFIAQSPPELSVNSGDTFNVTLLGYNTVPEPATYGLLGLGALAILFGLRQRQSAR